MKREGDHCFQRFLYLHCIQDRGAYLWAKASPLYDDEGRRIGAIEVIRDISQVKELQELLKNAKDGFVSETLGKISMPGAIDSGPSQQ